MKKISYGMTPPQDNLCSLGHCEANILVMVRNRNILPGLCRGRLQFSAQTGACVQMRHNIGWDQNRNSRISWRFLEIPEVIGDWHLILQLCTSNKCNPGGNFTLKKFLNICMYFIHIKSIIIEMWCYSEDQGGQTYEYVPTDLIWWMNNLQFIEVISSDFNTHNLNISPNSN